MMDGGSTLRRHNLQATFRDRSAADDVAAELRRAGVGATVAVNGPQDERAALRGEMREEVEAMVAGPGNIGPFTKAMTKGVALGVPLGAIVGAVLGLLLVLLPWGEELGLGLRLAIGLAVGAGIGATAGGIIGGFSKPRAEGEGRELDTETGVTVGVHTDSAGELRRAREILETRRPIRIDEADADGTPRRPGFPERTKPVRGETPTGDA